MDGLTNGAMGTVGYVLMNDKNPHTVLVEFDNKNVGFSAMKASKWKHLKNNSVPNSPYEASFFK